MENYMTKECPYCGSKEQIVSHGMRRPDQEKNQCNSCNSYFIYNTRNGDEYKLTNPQDINSPPYANKR